jgi:hypothetical protein
MVAGQRSETLIRGTEVAEIINGDVVTRLRSASVSDRAAKMDSGASVRAAHLFELTAESPRVQMEVKKVERKTIEVAADPKPAASVDYVAQLLARRDYRDVAAALGMDVATLDAKYAHLDAPKQRMCFGNLIRARYRKNPEQFVQL